jgi:hypothetical protein
MSKVNGFWFYGLSGSGKSYLSKKLKDAIKNSILVDGDNVRKWVSTDLKYSKKDREKQILRIFGISKIIIESNFFPISSSVYFNRKLLKLCKKHKIIVYKIDRINFELIKKNHKTYKNKSNVVGDDINYPKLITNKILNDNTSNFSGYLKVLKVLASVKKK